MPTRPKISLTDPDAFTLSHLPSEIIALIYAYYLAQDPLESRSQFLNLLVLSKEVYSENAWRLYEAVELNDQNHKAFFDGLWSGSRDIDVCPDPCPPFFLGEAPPFLRLRASAMALAREIEGYSHPKRRLKRPSHIPSNISYQEYEYESYIPFHLHPAIRKLLLIRQCRRLYIDSWQAFVGLRKANDLVRDAVNAWPREHDIRHAESSHYTWISDPLFSSVTHLSFGETVSLDAPDTSEERFPRRSKSFGPALKHVCLSFNDKCYDLEAEYEEEAQFGELDQFEERYFNDGIAKLLRERISFALRFHVDEKTSLTLHNAWPDEIERGLADTMIYELPRSTENGDGEWKRQIAMTTREMECYMSELEERMEDGRWGADAWRPKIKPWKVRFTNMAPIPPNTDIISAVLDDYPFNQDEHFDRLFKKWWDEVVSFEGPVKCDCCEIFKKRHPKINAYKYSYSTRRENFASIRERADEIREEYELLQSSEVAFYESQVASYEYPWL
ncbi:hypothetical protein L198_07956 [Cryptococcus wingfieldii CBS 7118]|uniref:Uncharacterized protein n=1 Tax=Cryptococcus wingfieldii CBS 7118 TaxID=1295528 RepID=A0A1E3HRZ0_9TREE|nr:hypothetical protein L198_07956 [Cryptococcus wingfieldii CBS 7118]ODN79072.1 hypothetical protein L198_07956 [Cryptococcus wingfieldii CBS 7118]